MRRTTVPGVALATILLSACGGTSSLRPAGATSARRGQPTVAQAKKQSVVITNYAFHPSRLTVTVGTPVTFTNRDQTSHTATSNRQGVFDTGTVMPGQSHTIVLKKPGVYPYHCEFHAFMRGEITVRPNSGG